MALLVSLIERRCAENVECRHNPGRNEPKRQHISLIHGCDKRWRPCNVGLPPPESDTSFRKPLETLIPWKRLPPLCPGRVGIVASPTAVHR